MPRRRRFSLPRRLCYASLLPVVVVVLVEAFSWFLYGSTFEDGFSHASLDAERQALADEKLRAGAVLFRNIQVPWRRAHVFHPFVGYVRNPEALIAGLDERFSTSEMGFLESEPAPRERSDDTVLVGIFGGSFAGMFFQSAQEVLVEELRKAPEYAGKQFHFIGGAIGGYKQPQQLMAMSYHMVLGQQFDLVLNLDGFNDVCLYPAAMRPLGLFPAYPRNWQLLTSDVNNYVNRLGDQVNQWRKQRKLVAKRFQKSWMRLSVTANLIWKVRDRTLEANILEAQELAVNPREEPDLTYEQTGPRVDRRSREEMYQELGALWARGSVQMRDLAEAHGARYFHFLQPNQYVPDSKPLGEEERGIALETRPHYQAHVLAGYPHLMVEGQHLRDQGVDFFDLSQVFQDVEEAVYIDSCCHINDLGNAIVARQMATRIRETLAGK